MSSLLAFNRVYRLEIESVMLVFGPRFVNYCASNLLSGSPPPSPSQSQSTVYTDSVWLWGGWGVLSPVGDHILQKFKTLYLIWFGTDKIAFPPQTKPRRRGPQSDKHLPQSPFTCQFFRLRHFALLSISLIFLRFYCSEAQKWLIKRTRLPSKCSDAAICAFVFDSRPAPPYLETAGSLLANDVLYREIANQFQTLLQLYLYSKEKVFI